MSSFNKKYDKCNNFRFKGICLNGCRVQRISLSFAEVYISKKYETIFCMEIKQSMHFIHISSSLNYGRKLTCTYSQNQFFIMV